MVTRAIVPGGAGLRGTALFASDEAVPERPVATLDHLVLATPDLGGTIRTVAERLGVEPTPGGQHPGRGTRNALVRLGPAAYLEIVGPDIEQPRPAQPRGFGIDALSCPRLVAWAARSHDLEELHATAARRRVKLGVVLSASRRRPDGSVLSWRYTDPECVLGDGIVPFFIDWGRTPHPSAGAVQGASLIGLRAEHPNPERVRDLLARLELRLGVQRGETPALVATIAGPRGRVELR
jgi:hypothetical protein